MIGNFRETEDQLNACSYSGLFPIVYLRHTRGGLQQAASPIAANYRVHWDLRRSNSKREFDLLYKSCHLTSPLSYSIQPRFNAALLPYYCLNRNMETGVSRICELWPLDTLFSMDFRFLSYLKLHWNIIPVL